MIAIYVLGLIVLKKNRMAFIVKVTIFINLFIGSGYFISLSGEDILYSEFSIVILCIFGFFYISNNDVNKNISRQSLFLITMLGIFIGIGFLNLINLSNNVYILPVGGSWDRIFFGTESLKIAFFGQSNILRLIRLILFLLCYYILEKFLKGNIGNVQNIKYFIVKSSVFMAFIGLIEQVTLKITSSNVVMEISKSILGIADSQLTWNVERAGMPVLQAFSLEPGHYAQSFLPGILILFTSNLFSEKYKTWCYMLFAYIIFSTGSFAGVAIIVLMSIIYIFNSKKMVLRKILSFSLFFVLISIFISIKKPILLEYFSMRIGAILFGTESIGTSDGVRVLSINTAKNLIKDNPILGLGLGTTDILGFLPSILINLGFLGAIIWFIFCLKGFGNNKSKNIYILFMLLPIYYYVGGIRNLYALDTILIFLLVFQKNIPSLSEVKIDKVKKYNYKRTLVLLKSRLS